MNVVNRHHHKGPWPKDRQHYYIGWHSWTANSEILRGAIDATALHNPFRFHGSSRELSLERYRQHLRARLRAEPNLQCFLAAMHDDAVLICSCAPLPCHGNVIVRARAWVLAGMPEKPEDGCEKL